MIKIKDYIFNENEIKRIELLRYTNYSTIEVTTNDGRCDCGPATFEDIEWNYEDEQIRKCLDSINREEELEEENKKLKEELHKASLDIQELTEKDIGCPSWCDKLKELEEENKQLKELNVCVGCENNPDYKTRIKELDKENTKLLSENVDLHNENVDLYEEENEKKLESINCLLKDNADLVMKINKAIEYIEELYTRYIADYSDIERLEKILKGSEE